MTTGKIPTGLLLFVLLGLVAGLLPAPAQETGEEAQEDPMAAYAKYATPGEHHGHLATLAGKWSATVKLWMQPGAPPIESTGTMTSTMILNGRFLKAEYEGESMGQPFLGMSIDGYDNYAEKHVGMWIDSMGTMVLNFTGECEKAGSVRTMHTKFDDPLTGAKQKMKTVLTIESPDRHVYEAYLAGPDGEPFKGMEIVFTRM
jgi:hypothetical protein